MFDHRANQDFSLVPGLLQVAKDSKVWADAPYNLTQVFQQLVNVIVKTDDIGYTALLSVFPPRPSPACAQAVRPLFLF